MVSQSKKYIIHYTVTGVNVFMCPLLGFMNFVVMPLFKEWYRFNRTSLSEVMLSNIKANADNWDRIALEAEAQKV